MVFSNSPVNVFETVWVAIMTLYFSAVSRFLFTGQEDVGDFIDPHGSTVFQLDGILFRINAGHRAILAVQRVTHSVTDTNGSGFVYGCSFGIYGVCFIVFHDVCSFAFHGVGY